MISTINTECFLSGINQIVFTVDSLNIYRDVKGKIHPRTSYEGPELWGGGVEVQLYSCFNFGVRWGQVFNATPSPRNLREGDPVLIEQEAGQAPGPVWKCAEKSPPRDSILGFCSPCESLYRLLYPCPHTRRQDLNSYVGFLKCMLPYKRRNVCICVP